MEFTIRKATEEDSKQLAGLLSELGYPNTPEFVRKKIARISKSENDTLLVAETLGLVIGAVHLHISEMIHRPGRLGRVIALIVTSNYRWFGVGRQLMTHAENLARESGCSLMEVTSRIQREDAHAFYKHLGYSEKPWRFVKKINAGEEEY
jgi:N-acetylglutamate synthase-like GNAT family acetyltransferase